MSTNLETARREVEAVKAATYKLLDEAKAEQASLEHDLESNAEAQERYTTELDQLEAAAAALGAPAPTRAHKPKPKPKPAAKREGPGRGKRSSPPPSRTSPSPPTSTPAKPAPSRPGGNKDRVLAYIRANPDSSGQEIAKGVGIHASEVSKSVNDLRGKIRVRRDGRSKRYSAVEADMAPPDAQGAKTGIERSLVAACVGGASVEGAADVANVQVHVARGIMANLTSRRVLVKDGQVYTPRVPPELDGGAEREVEGAVRRAAA